MRTFCMALLLLGVAFAQDEPAFTGRDIPDWFDDAKLGIFIHWGVYSVPAWAPTTGELEAVLEEHGWEYWFANNPYAEWYANSMKIEDSATADYHTETYGVDVTYGDFAADFNEAISAWNPDAWADLFAEAGAGYVVLTTKHHDGFLLWPSDTPNPFIEGHMASRDIVGELTEAVRERDMRMGLYYSGGIDWTFNDLTITSFETLLQAINQSEAYEQYATAHWRELIDRYQPAVLWNDLGYPAVGDLNGLFSYYYEQVPDGVINNRFDLGGETGLHYDFTTPEYAVLEDIDLNKWESTRGLGFSFGYNRNEALEDYLSSDALIVSFVDIVSKGGNLLLNVGPLADGTIPEVQAERLRDLGAWLAVNGEAIYSTDPWRRAAAETDGGVPVRFTQRDGVLYVVLLDTPNSTTFALPLELADGTTVTALGGEDVTWEADGEQVSITVSVWDEAFAHAFRVDPAP